eukprot:5159568-Prymnesium_polylepis.1
MRDAYREVHPAAAGQYTYWSQRARNRPRNRGLRIDYFLVGGAMPAGETSARADPRLPEAPPSPRSCVSVWACRVFPKACAHFRRARHASFHGG